MDRKGVEELCAAVIEVAVFDRRHALTHEWVDEQCKATRELTGREREVVEGLDWFFNEGGLEIMIDVAGFNLDAERIRKKSNEKY